MRKNVIALFLVAQLLIAGCLGSSESDESVGCQNPNALNFDPTVDRNDEALCLTMDAYLAGLEPVRSQLAGQPVVGGAAFGYTLTSHDAASGMKSTVAFAQDTLYLSVEENGSTSNSWVSSGSIIMESEGESYSIAPAKEVSVLFSEMWSSAPNLAAVAGSGGNAPVLDNGTYRTMFTTVESVENEDGVPEQISYALIIHLDAETFGFVSALFTMTDAEGSASYDVELMSQVSVPAAPTDAMAISIPFDLEAREVSSSMIDRFDPKEQPQLNLLAEDLEVWGCTAHYISESATGYDLQTMMAAVDTAELPSWCNQETEEIVYNNTPADFVYSTYLVSYSVSEWDGKTRTEATTVSFTSSAVKWNYANGWVLGEDEDCDGNPGYTLADGQCIYYSNTQTSWVKNNDMYLNFSNSDDEPVYQRYQRLGDDVIVIGSAHLVSVCNDGTFISAWSINDGTLDCADGGDEDGTQVMFDCGEGITISNAALNDGIADCPDGSDETLQSIEYVVKDESGFSGFAQDYQVVLSSCDNTGACTVVLESGALDNIDTTSGVMWIDLDYSGTVSDGDEIYLSTSRNQPWNTVELRSV